MSTHVAMKDKDAVKPTLRVLVVEKHQKMRNILRRMLHQTGYFQDVAETADGEEGWQLLRESTFDLVIANTNLPRLSGISLLERCHTDETLKDIPFIFIAGETSREDLAKAVAYHAYDYLLIPFSFSMIKNRIDSTLKRLNSPGEQLYRHTEKMIREGHFEEALQRIEMYETYYSSSNVRWLNLKGECLMGLGMVEEAASALERAVEVCNVYLPALKQNADIQEKLGNTERSMELLKEVDKLGALDMGRKIHLGQLLIKAGSTEDGIKMLRNAMHQASPEEQEEFGMQAAEIMMESKRYEEAEKMFESLLESRPKTLAIYNRLGIALRQQGKYRKAREYYVEALKYYPDDPVIYYNLAILYLAQKDRGNAVRYLQNAVKRDAEFQEALDLLSKIGESVNG